MTCGGSSKLEVILAYEGAHHKKYLCYNEPITHVVAQGDKQTVKVSRIILGLGAILGVAVLSVAAVSAVSYGGGNVQGYSGETSLDNGTIVELTGADSNKVKIANQANLQNMFGVTVDRTQLLNSSSNGTVENEVFVAVSGTYNVLVSDQAGAIVSGDYVTLSSVDGVAMKAGTEESTVFGRAGASFAGAGASIGSATLKDTKGQTNKTVRLGIIPVTIDIKRNPNEKSTEANLPEILERIGQAVAEKEVDPIRIYISLAITAVRLITAIIVIYAGVRNSVISIGRNPMSKKSIFRALLEIILTAILILIVGLFAVYLLLRL